MARAVDAAFWFPANSVEVACLGDSGEATLLREVLEHLGARVYCHWVGQPLHFLEIIGDRGVRCRYLIVAGHGDEEGLIFGEYASSIDVSMLRDGKLPPECIAEHAHLPGMVVLSTCCLAGLQPMAEAFLRGGAEAYIGALDEPHGDTTPVFVMHLFHALFHRRRSLREAWEHAASYDEEGSMFALYDGEGCHRVCGG